MKINFSLQSAVSRLRKFLKTLGPHAAFIAITAVLIVYLLVVWRINRLASAEPSPEMKSASLSTVKIPNVDKNAITQIQALEQNNTQVHSLFNTARNNPFQE